MEDKEQKIKLTFETNADAIGSKVDGVTTKLDKTTKATEGVEGAQKKASKSTKDLGGGLEELGGPIGGAISGFKAMLKQMWLLVANPIGAVLTVIVGVVALLGKSFLSTEEGGNKLGKGLAVISGLFSGLLKVLQPVATFLIDGIVKGFETVGNAIIETSVLIQKGLRALGLDSAASGLQNITNAVSSNIKASGSLADAENKLTAARRESNKIQLDFQKKAEIIRQQRDDESNSIEKRFKLNKQLAGTLKQQAQEELKIANLAKSVSDLRIKQEGKSSANLDERAAALLQISDIQERISGQESEQLANENSLRNEQKSLNKEALTKRLADAKLIEDSRIALLKEGADAENAIRKTNEDFADKTEEQKLARQKERAFQEIEILKKKGIDTAELTILNAEKFGNLEKELELKRAEEKKVADEKIAADKKAVDASMLKLAEDLEAAKFSITDKALNLFGMLAGKNKKLQKAALIAESAVAIGRTITATSASSAAAVASGAALAIPTAGASVLAAGKLVVANKINAGLNIATIIASTGKALSSLGGGGGGLSGSTPNGSGGGGGATARPQVDFQASRENQIATAVSTSASNQPPIQAYVVSKTITTAQAADRNKINSNSI